MKGRVHINVFHLFFEKTCYVWGLFPRYRQQADGALVISRLSIEDAGFFTCIASNGHAQDQRRIQIRPQGTWKGRGRKVWFDTKEAGMGKEFFILFFILLSQAIRLAVPCIILTG